MSAANRVLVLGAFVLGLAPALAVACDEADAKKAAEARATCTATSTITVTATSKAAKSCTVTATVKACTEAALKAEGAAASKQRRPGWSPGHLIEPDSMRLAPQQNPESPGEEWVIISSRNGAIQMIRTQDRPSAKKHRQTRKA